MRDPAGILVVDDDPAVLETLRACLSDEGYRVATARSVDEAVPALRDGGFALVLTDALVRLRGEQLDYWASIDQVRAAAGASPVAILSAHPPERFAGLEGRGFVALIAKPFEIDEFCDTVRRLIGGARAR